VPVTPLANQLALKAANSRLEGRLAQEDDIRDAYHLTPQGEARAPYGDGLLNGRTRRRGQCRSETLRFQLVGL